MTDGEVLQKLRRFLLILSLFLFSGALIELYLVEHTQDFIQWIPFVLSFAGLLVVILVLVRPARGPVLVLRIVMALVAFGSLLGIYEHITGNIEFEREVQPSSTTTQLLERGLRGGNPLLAPGVLAIAAVIAVSSTYKLNADQEG